MVIFKQLQGDIGELTDICNDISTRRLPSTPKSANLSHSPFSRGTPELSPRRKPPLLPPASTPHSTANHEPPGATGTPADSPHSKRIGESRSVAAIGLAPSKLVEKRKISIPAMSAAATAPAPHPHPPAVNGWVKPAPELAASVLPTTSTGKGQRPKPPPVAKKPSKAVLRSSGLIDASPPPELVRQPPEPVHQPPEPVQQPPKPVRQPPQPVRQPPQPVRQPPQPVRQSSEPVRQPPQPVRQSPEPVRQPPEPVRQPPEPVRHSPVHIKQSDSGSGSLLSGADSTLGKTEEEERVERSQLKASSSLNKLAPNLSRLQEDEVNTGMSRNSSIDSGIQFVDGGDNGGGALGGFGFADEVFSKLSFFDS